MPSLLYEIVESEADKFCICSVRLSFFPVKCVVDLYVTGSYIYNLYDLVILWFSGHTSQGHVIQRFHISSIALELFWFVYLRLYFVHTSICVINPTKWVASISLSGRRCFETIQISYLLSLVDKLIDAISYIHICTHTHICRESE